MSGLAVVLFNLGGPASLPEVRPFLRRLFSDRAILDLPAAVRLPLAALIAAVRAPLARRNYARIGGASPLLAHTRAQAAALQAALAKTVPDTKVFVAMRHAAPFAAETARAVAAFAPDRTVLLPLYPQYSTTTTASSLAAWRAAGDGSATERIVCCWPDAAGLAGAHADAILDTWRAAGEPRVRLLLSAHGLPSKVAEAGDPYAWQVERTCAAITARLGPGWDWRLCYQSRVGPLKWLGPSTSDEIAAAAREGLGVLVAPISFVSEHVETLAELDHDYAALARRLGAPCYLRAPAPGVAPAFIETLAGIVLGALEREGLAPAGLTCPAACAQCPFRAPGRAA
jgi:ferrochelatase